MRKFLAVLKREYTQRVRAKMFIVSTILLPLVMSLFGIVPAVILSIEAAPMRVAVIDQTGKIYAHLEEALASDESKSDEPDQTRTGPEVAGRTFHLEQVAAIGPEANEERARLEARLQNKELDGYLVIPAEFLQHGQVEFFNNNPGDVLSRRILQSALNRAAREERLVEARVDAETRQGLFQPVNLQSVKIGAAGEERDSGGSFILVFGV
ncbi:MAG TPA: ABC transporter permease, partial [Pyrinomonadaceae bacterium]|nr:ABC transporter permease [Pyrinomonadaceae bacterium]